MNEFDWVSDYWYKKALTASSSRSGRRSARIWNTTSPTPAPPFLVELDNDLQMARSNYLLRSYYNLLVDGRGVDCISWQLDDPTQQQLSLHGADRVRRRCRRSGRCSG